MRVFQDPPQKAARNIALVGETLGAVRAIMVEGPSGLLSVSPPDQRPRFISSRNLLLWPNGARAQLFSSARPQSLRGPQFDAAWCDELGKWRNDQQTWDMLQFGLRLGACPQQVITTTPRNTHLLRSLLDDPHCAVTRASTSANKAHLAPNFLRDIVGKYQGSRLGRQELEAEMLEEEGAGLWSKELIQRQRRDRVPHDAEYIISLDPAVGVGSKVDRCGIIVLARCAEGYVYVVADASCQGLSPFQWSRHVQKVYRQYGAQRLIAEVNQGGELVREVVLRDAPHIRFRAVRAYKNKVERAHPVVALYERGLVFHVGYFQQLEEEMCSFHGSGPSPDRLDALVWGVTHLLLSPRDEPHIRKL